LNPHVRRTWFTVRWASQLLNTPILIFLSTKKRTQLFKVECDEKKVIFSIITYPTLRNLPHRHNPLHMRRLLVSCW